MKMPQFLVKTVIFIIFKNPHFLLFSGVLEVKLKFQDKFYNIIDYNKYPSSEKEDEKGIFRKSYFHQIQPNHEYSILQFYLPKYILSSQHFYILHGEGVPCEQSRMVAVSSMSAISCAVAAG